jgi:hypothetical protein
MWVNPLDKPDMFTWHQTTRRTLKDKPGKKAMEWVHKIHFCDSYESVEYPLNSYPFACLVWRVVHFTFTIHLATNVTNRAANELSLSEFELA